MATTSFRHLEYIFTVLWTLSRRLLWLRVYSSNKDQFVIGSYFFDFTKEEKGTMFIWINAERVETASLVDYVLDTK